jgi:hypothetical protein
VVLGLAYIGAKGFIYFKAKNALDKIVRLASPVVQIDYTDIGSKLSGTIYIDNIRLTPTGTYDEATIEKLSITGNGFKFLLDLSLGVNSNEPPPQMRIAFDNLQMPVSDLFLSNLSSPFKTNTDNKEIDTCSIPGILNASGLREIDISTITVNGSFGYMYDKSASQAELNLKYDLAGIESTLLDIRLNQLSSSTIAGIGKLPIVEKFHLIRKYKPEYIKKIIGHCATNSSLATATFVDDLFTQSDDYYLNTLGFVPGPGLSKLFKQLVSNAGTVEIIATPSSEISPALLKAYRPEDLVDLFGVTASYNSIPITDLSFSTKSSSEKRKQQQIRRTTNYVQQPTTATENKATKTRAKKKVKLRFLDTEVTNLNSYLHHKVRVYTLNKSKPKRGILTAIASNKIDVEHLVFGGKMSSHIYIDTVERVEVLRKERPEDK